MRPSSDNPRRAIIITRQSSSYVGDAVVDGGWVHLTECRVRHAAGGTRTSDKTLAQQEIREIRWVDDEPELAA